MSTIERNDLMDIEAVLLYTELEESTLDYLMAINQFPLPLHLSNDAHPRWYRDEIDDWLEDPQRSHL